MPVPDFEWKAYQVPGGTGDLLRHTGLAAAAETTVTVDIRHRKTPRLADCKSVG